MNFSINFCFLLIFLSKIRFSSILRAKTRFLHARKKGLLQMGFEPSTFGLKYFLKIHSAQNCDCIWKILAFQQKSIFSNFLLKKNRRFLRIKYKVAQKSIKFGGIICQKYKGWDFLNNRQKFRNFFSADLMFFGPKNA